MLTLKLASKVNNLTDTTRHGFDGHESTYGRLISSRGANLYLPFKNALLHNTLG